MSRNSTFNIQHLTFNIPRSFERQTMLLNYQDLSPVKKSVEVEIPADLISTSSAPSPTKSAVRPKFPAFAPAKLPPRWCARVSPRKSKQKVRDRCWPPSFRVPQP